MTQKTSLWWCLYLIGLAAFFSPALGQVPHTDISLPPGHSKAVLAVAFHPDGKLLASAGKDGTVRLWEVGSWRPLAVLDENDAYADLIHDPEIVTALVFPPDGKTLLWGTNWGNRLWDLQNRRSIEVNTPRANSLLSAPVPAKGPHSKWRVRVSEGGIGTGVELLDADTGKKIAKLEQPISSHSGTILAHAFSPDGKWLAAGDNTGNVIVWDTNTRKSAALLQTDYFGMCRFSLSRDGKRLAIGGQLSPTVVWDLDRSQILRRFGEHAFRPGVCLRPDGKVLAVGDRKNNKIRLLDVDSGKELAAWPAFAKQVEIDGLVFSPDGSVLLVSGRDTSFRICEPMTGKDLWLYQGKNPAVGRLAFSADGSKFAVPYFLPHLVKIFETKTGKELQSYAGHNKGGEIRAVAFSADGSTMASSARFGNTQIWSALNGKTLAAADSSAVALAFHPSGKYLAGGRTLDGYLQHNMQIWDTSTGKEICRWEAHLTPEFLAFGAGGKKLLAGGQGGQVQGWQTPLENLAHILPEPGAAACAVFDRTGKLLATGNNEGKIIVWDVKTGKAIATLLGKNKQPVHSLAFSPDGSSLACCSDEISIWDVPQQKEKARVAKRQAELRFSSDGKAVLATLLDRSQEGWLPSHELFDTATGKLLRATELSILSPDGRWLAVLNEKQNVVELLDAGTGASVRVLPKPQRPVHCLAFSPDSKTLAVAEMGPHIHFWDVATGKSCRKPLEVGRSELSGKSWGEFPMLGMAYSPDGNRLLISDQSRQDVSLWDLKQARKPQILSAEIVSVPRSAFAAGGRVLLTRSIVGCDYLDVWDLVAGKHRSKSAKLAASFHGQVACFLLPDGDLLIRERVNARWVRWDLETDARHGVTAAGAGDVLAVSPDGRLAVCRAGMLTLWSIPARGR